MRQLCGKRQVREIVTHPGTVVLMHTNTCKLHIIIKIDVLISDELEFFLYRKSRPELCGKSHDPESPYYQPLNPCIAGTRSVRWIPIEHRSTWPSQARQNSTELEIHGKYMASVCIWKKYANGQIT
jgi:hypothetical protein